MEDCRTPTLAQVVDFKYERSPTMVFDANRLQEAQNFFANRTNVRCFTPTTDHFQSPGLSPISEMAKTFINRVVESGFQKPLVTMEKKDRYKSPTTMSCMPIPQQQFVQQQLQQQQQQLQQQQQQQQQLKQNRCAQSAHYISDSPVFALNSTAIADTECSLEVTSPDVSRIQSNVSCLLDRTLNVTTLLRSVGLEQYAEVFEKQNFDLEQFLCISAEELQRFGVRSHEHRRIILELLNEFNGI